MNYYTETNYYDHDSLMTAGGKGRDDYFEVLRRAGLKCIRIPTLRTAGNTSAISRVNMERELRKAWRKALSGLGEGDVLFLHSPVAEKFLRYPDVIKEVRERGCKIVNIVFDLETFFKSDYKKLAYAKHALDGLSEAKIFALSDVIICHNSKMQAKLESLGVDGNKIVCVGVMDYLRDSEISNTERFGPDKPVVFCSNLAKSKSGFVYKLASADIPGLKMDIYGPDYSGQVSESIVYKGSLPALELMDTMEGSFGLVWDGTSIETCKGACGEYLSFNNPHKMSHYLASGMPVIVWNGAAMADFVRKEQCGLIIRNLRDIPGLISSLSADEYESLRTNAERVGEAMRRGKHIMNAVKLSLAMLGQIVQGRKYDYLIVGAGLYGASIARELTDRGCRALVVEKRNHIAGNSYTENVEGICVHRYGPHIFHTDNERVWEFVNRFAVFNTFVNQPKANYHGEIYSLPFNMNTFSEMWGVSDPQSAAEIISKQVEDSGLAGKIPQNLEEQAIKQVGTDIYEKLIKGYTEKQWGHECKELPADIIRRIPVRYEYNNNYFDDKYQGIPTDGYTVMAEKMLEGIDVLTGVDFLDEYNRSMLAQVADTIIYSGRIDSYFDCCYGELECRTLRFETESVETSDGCFQEAAVVNYTDADTPWMRIIEHKQFAQINTGNTSIITKEYPSVWTSGSEAYYPVNNERNMTLLGKYQNRAKKEHHVVFGGRLGTYSYCDMDDVIEMALEDADRLKPECTVGEKGSLSSKKNIKNNKANNIKKALVVFTREPAPGKTKTRLMPYYSGEQCADLHKCMIKDIAREAKRTEAEILVSYTGGEPVFLRSVFRRNTVFSAQRGDTLGEKMENAVSDAFMLGYDKVVLIGTDIPEIISGSLDNAFDMLNDNDVVLGPTDDGGYYLIGMSAPHHEAFDVKLYGTASVFRETIESIRGTGLSAGIADIYYDLDTPEDLAGFRDRMRENKTIRKSCTGRFLAATSKISVIVPVFNEEAAVGNMMQQLRPYKNDLEIIFVDGGSTDRTTQIIGEEFTLVTSPKGRGMQLNRGALASSGDILFFLHCDSILPDDFPDEIRRIMTEYKWGCFGVKFPSRNFFMFTNRIISNHRAKFRRLPFGDQGVFVDRNLFLEAGMFKEMAIMEDYEFAREMKRKGIVPGMAGKRIESSARRYGSGTSDILRTEFMMWKLRRLYCKGVSTDKLAEFYKDVRS